MASRLLCTDSRSALELAANSDSKLVLLTGTDPLRLRDAAEREATSLGWRAIRFNDALALRLAPYMPAERPNVAWEVLEEVVGDHRGATALIGTDLLWEPSLGYDPYSALRRLGRHGPLLATWFGTVVGPDIIRAQPGHPEFTRDRLDVPYVVVD